MNALRWSRRGLAAALASLLIATVLLAPKPAAAEAGEYVEPGDAGSTLATAAFPGGAGALTKISGAFSAKQDEDIYRICVTGTFKATMAASFDSTLYLLDDEGFGVVSNDDATGGSEISGWPVGAGVYYLAVAIFDHDPVAADGSELFPDEPYEGAKGPDEGVGPLDHWSGFVGGAFGSYDIALEGASYCGGVPVVTSSMPSTGTRAGGTTVTISGSGFTGATAVRIGTVAAASYTIDSDTQITATTPGRPECPEPVQAIKVAGPAGFFSARTSAATFAYDTTGCPKVTSLSPSRGVPGTAVTVTGANFTGATAVTFGATPAASFTINSDTQINAVSPQLDLGIYDVIVAKGPELSTTGVASKYEAGLTPAVTALSQSQGSPLGGTVFEVNGANFTDDSQVLFGSTPASGVSVQGSSSLSVTAPALPSHTVVDLRVVTRFGTSPITPADRFTFVYNPVPTGITPDAGPSSGGTGVVVSGSGFLGVTAVLFGEQRVPCPQQCNVVSAGEIDVQTLPHAIGAVHVRLESPDGPSAAGRTFAFTGVGGFTSSATCLPQCASNGAVLLSNGKVVGVSGTFVDPKVVTQANIYDPATDTWEKGAICDDCGLSVQQDSSLTLLPSGPSAACGANCGKILVLGASGHRLYDPVADAWGTTGPHVITDVSFHTATLLDNGKVLIVGPTKAELFDPLTAAFSLVAAPLHDHGSHAATKLTDGRVLVTGGGSSGSLSASAELYNAATNTWTDTGAMTQARYAHASTLLKDGRVLVTGGQLGESAATVSSEIWNPTTGTWSPTTKMIFARSDHAVTLVSDGRLLAIGGDQPGIEPSTGYGIGHNPTLGEVFDPATQEWLPTNPSKLPVGANNVDGQSNVVRNIALPTGPESVCGTRCGQVLVVRTGDDGSPANLPTAVLFAAPPRATLAPSTGLPAGGTVVTLTGSGLASVKTVTFGGVAGTSVTPDPIAPDSKATVVTPARLEGTVDVAVTTAGGTVIAGRFTFETPPAPPPAANPTPAAAPQISVLPTVIQAPTPAGYAMAAADGGVFSFGSLPFAGSLGGARPNQPIAAIEHTPSGKGYWLVGADGAVFAFGDAAFKGSTGGIRLAKPIVDIVGTPSGAGYFLIGSDGGVFAFGDAAFKGSTGALKLNSPIVAAERSTTGNGYWLIGSDGGVFAFGDAAFKGSTGARTLAQPVVSVARSAAGYGYWLIAADGGVFAFGDATFHGSTGALKLNSPIVGSAPAAAGSGYVLCAKDGGAFAFGAAGFAGSMGGSRLNSPITSCSGPRPTAT